MPLPFRLRTFNPPLPAAGAWQLSFTDDGVGFISKVHPDACVKWVREVFRLSLHENDAGDRFLYDREANACLKLESLARQMTQMVFSYESADHGSFKSEVYVFQLPRTHPAARVFWVLPWAQTAVWGTNVHNRWVCRNSKALTSWLGFLGFTSPEQHLRHSMKSLAARARAHDENLESGDLFSGEQEFSVTTSGLLAILAGWASKSLMKSTETSPWLARQVLSTIYEAIVLDGSFVWATPGGRRLAITDGSLDGDAMKEQSPQLKRKLGGLGQYIQIGDALVRLMCCWKTARGPAPSAALELEDYIQGLVYFGHDCAEAGLDREPWSRGHASLPVLRLATSCRPRRVSMGKKVSMATEVASSAQLQKCSQLVAAEQVIARRDGRPDPVQPKSAARFVRDRMYQYWLATREMFAERTHITFCSDGGRVAGQELELVAIYDVRRHMGCWGPPQVGGRPLALSDVAGCARQICIFDRVKSNFKVRQFRARRGSTSRFLTNRRGPTEVVR